MEIKFLFPNGSFPKKERQTEKTGEQAPHFSQSKQVLNEIRPAVGPPNRWHHMSEVCSRRYFLKCQWKLICFVLEFQGTDWNYISSLHAWHDKYFSPGIPHKNIIYSSCDHKWSLTLGEKFGAESSPAISQPHTVEASLSTENSPLPFELVDEVLFTCPESSGFIYSAALTAHWALFV